VFGQNNETNISLESQLVKLDRQRDSLISVNYQFEIEDVITRINKELERNALQTEDEIQKLWVLSNELNHKLQQKLSIARPEISNALTQRLNNEPIERTENNDGYQLGSRKSISRPKPIYDCNGEGVVVVRIWVDKSGIVQNAKGEVSGSTTSLSCLVRRAEEAAFKTRFEGDPMATDLQVGSIRYNFYHL
jgi:hypothetical protein